MEEWGYKGKILVETTTVNINLLTDFLYEERPMKNNPSLKIKILFLSRLIREKGIFELIEAFKSLKGKYSNIELIVAGDGKDFGDIANYVKDEKDIIMTGHVDGKEKISFEKNNKNKTKKKKKRKK